MNMMQFFRDGPSRPLVKKPRSWRVNWWQLWLAAIWFYHQNHYFGWNRAPKSDAELICDGLVFLLLALAVRPSNGRAEHE